MKIKFMAEFCGKRIEEVVTIDERSIKGQGYWARNEINRRLSNWAEKKLETEYEILDDERFEVGFNNMPYVDEEAKKILHWR